ncbi:MAG: Rpp14/Pop5 family protein [Metallosphaera sp.]|uniref:Rpp14/Pop5 family protein n=1 Tax=Metallosphaera TaxID=41980 RepID=UPI00064FC08B|nr:Rpp14/Pop5 family protein [Metallosphaera cuprina]
MYQTYLNIIIILWLSIITFILILKLKNKSFQIDLNRRYKLSKNKKRYIIFRLISNKQDISPQAIEESIKDGVSYLGGKMWLDLSSPHVIFFDPHNMMGIISTNRIGYKMVIASLPFVKSINGVETLLIPYKTTGSLKKAKSLIRSR